MKIKVLLLALVFSLAPFMNASASEAAGGDGHVYRGKYTNYSDIIYTWDGKHLYRGKYSNYSDILYTWDGKYIYKGRFTNTSDILYTFDGKHLYRGRFTNTSDILLTLGAPVPVVIMLLNTL